MRVVAVAPQRVMSMYVLRQHRKYAYNSHWRSQTRNLCYRKDDRAMRPIHGCPEHVRDSLSTPTARPTTGIPNIFYGLLFRSTLWMFLQNLKSVALPVPEIIPKIGQSTLLFLQKWTFIRIGPVNVPAKFEVRPRGGVWHLQYGIQKLNGVHGSKKYIFRANVTLKFD